MRKQRILALTLLPAVLALSGCGKQGSDAPEADATKAPPIVTVATEAPTEAPEKDTSTLMTLDELMGMNMLPDTEDLPVDEDLPAADPDATPSPEPTATPEPQVAAEDIPFQVDQVAEDGQTVINTAPKTFEYATLTDPSFGFVMSYPTEWVNLPGKYTVCFQEAEPATAFPARVAVTRKQVAHTPKAAQVYSQFQSYAQIIYQQYDPKTFEYSDVNSRGVFMGHQAYEVTYLAYSGDIEVEGYMCCCSIDKALYVFHFCCPYNEYDSYASAMNRMRDSVTSLVDEDA